MNNLPPIPPGWRLIKIGETIPYGGYQYLCAGRWKPIIGLGWTGTKHTGSSGPRITQIKVIKPLPIPPFLIKKETDKDIILNLRNHLVRIIKNPNRKSNRIKASEYLKTLK